MGNLSLKRAPASVPNDQQSPLQPAQQVNFTAHEHRLLRAYLRDFVGYHPSRPKDLQAISIHWDQLNLVHHHPVNQQTGVAPIMQLFDVFYRYLFELAPDTQSLYHHSIKFKGRALMNIISGIRNVLHSPNVLATAAGIAHRHVLYGVKCEHFNPFGLALMRTLEVLAPTLWTPQVADAWHRAYVHVAVLVLDRFEREVHNSAPGPTIVLTSSARSLIIRRRSCSSAEGINKPIGVLYTPPGSRGRSNSSVDLDSHTSESDSTLQTKSYLMTERRPSLRSKQAFQIQTESRDSNHSFSRLTELSTSTSLSAQAESPGTLAIVRKRSSYKCRRQILIAPDQNSVTEG